MVPPAPTTPDRTASQPRSRADGGADTATPVRRALATQDPDRKEAAVGRALQRADRQSPAFDRLVDATVALAAGDSAEADYQLREALQLLIIAEALQ